MKMKPMCARCTFHEARTTRKLRVASDYRYNEVTRTHRDSVVIRKHLDVDKPNRSFGRQHGTCESWLLDTSVLWPFSYYRASSIGFESTSTKRKKAYKKKNFDSTFNIELKKQISKEENAEVQKVMHFFFNNRINFLLGNDSNLNW